MFKFIKYKSVIFLLLGMTLISCSCLLNMVDEEGTNEKIDPATGNTNFSIIFSNNIAGETHSCGCRKFPLGGIPQAAGVIAKIRRSSSAIYIDSGDTFFPTNILPQAFEKSLKYGAETILNSMNKLGLNYFTPGEYDFAAGEDFLAKLSEQAKFQFVITNLKNNSKIKHKQWMVTKVGEKRVFIMGVINPQLLTENQQKLFVSPESAIENILKDMKDRGFKEDSPQDILILISHMGLDDDKIFAKKFPAIDWIIGSHDQSFIQHPVIVGSTKIVQVSEKNHYLGEISLPLSAKANKYFYKLHEVSDGMERELKPNPFLESIDKYKNRLTQIQKEEERAMIKNN